MSTKLLWVAHGLPGRAVPCSLGRLERLLIGPGSTCPLFQLSVPTASSVPLAMILLAADRACWINLQLIQIAFNEIKIEQSH